MRYEYNIFNFVILWQPLKQYSWRADPLLVFWCAGWRPRLIGTKENYIEKTKLFRLSILRKSFFLSLNTRCQWAGVATKQRYPWQLSASKTTIIQVKNIRYSWQVRKRLLVLFFYSSRTSFDDRKVAGGLVDLSLQGRKTFKIRWYEIRTCFLYGGPVFPRFDYSLNI